MSRTRRTKERFERLEETILVLRQMFGDDDGPFEGEHYRLAETVNNPQVVRAGRAAAGHRRRR